MKDRKAIFKNLSAFGIVVGLWILLALMTSDMVTLLEGLTAVVFVAGITILATDVMEKAFYDPALFTWQYLAGGGLVLVSAGLWLFFAACETWLQFALRGLVFMAAVAGTFCWYWFFYSVSVMSDDERLVAKLSKAYRKAARAFPSLDDEGVRDALKETLFCRLEGDSLEGDLLSDQPIVPGYRTYSQLFDASDLSDQEKSAALTNINQYINLLIRNRNKENTASV